MPISLAVVLVLGVFGIVLVLVVILSPVLIVVLGVVLVLVIHCLILQFCIYGMTAFVVYPTIYDLSLGLKIKLTTRPATMAAVMPPAVAFSPPVNTPSRPSSFTAS